MARPPARTGGARRARLGAALAGAALLGACGPGAATDPAPAPERAYDGVETRLLDGDLVSFLVTMRGATGPADVEDYGRCAAAQYALIRGYGFARHVRTLVDERAGIWSADAVYTISPALPEGVQTIDAEVTVANCARNGIPTV